jgi:hypothetical protein
MLKASWGGGGKGIRKVQGDEDVRAVFKQIQGEVRGPGVGGAEGGGAEVCGGMGLWGWDGGVAVRGGTCTERALVREAALVWVKGKGGGRAWGGGLCVASDVAVAGAWVAWSVWDGVQCGPCPLPELMPAVPFCTPHVA